MTIESVKCSSEFSDYKSFRGNLVVESPSSLWNRCFFVPNSKIQKNSRFKNFSESLNNEWWNIIKVFIFWNIEIWARTEPLF